MGTSKSDATASNFRLQYLSENELTRYTFDLKVGEIEK